MTLFNDMAEQLQGTTRELEARRRYMEIILESIPTGVISVDPDLRVNKINRAARTMFSVGDRLDAGSDFWTGCGFDSRIAARRRKRTAITREIEFNVSRPSGAQRRHRNASDRRVDSFSSSKI